MQRQSTCFGGLSCRACRSVRYCNHGHLQGRSSTVAVAVTQMQPQKQAMPTRNACTINFEQRDAMGSSTAAKGLSSASAATHAVVHERASKAYQIIMSNLHTVGSSTAARDPPLLLAKRTSALRAKLTKLCSKSNAHQKSNNKQGQSNTLCTTNVVCACT